MYLFKILHNDFVILTSVLLLERYTACSVIVVIFYHLLKQLSLTFCQQYLSCSQYPEYMKEI